MSEHLENVQIKAEKQYKILSKIILMNCSDSQADEEFIYKIITEQVKSKNYDDKEFVL